MVRDSISTFFRYKWRALAFFLLVIAGTVGTILWWPRSYASEARLFVRLGRESVSLDPTATTGQTVSINESRESEINSVVQMLSSRRVVEIAVDKIGPEVVLTDPVAEAGGEEKRSPYTMASLMKSAKSKVGEVLSSIDPVDQRETAIQGVLRGLDVAAERKSSVVNVRFKDKTPEKAQLITNAVVDAYLAEHLRVNRTHGSKEFFDHQAELMFTSWEESAKALEHAKNELGLVSVESQAELLQRESSNVDSELVLAVSAQSAAEARVKALEHTLQQLPERMVVAETDGHPNEALDGMREQLYELEIQQRELTSKFTANHVTVQAINAQVEEARKVLESQEEQRVQSTTAVNPAFEALRQNLYDARVDAVGLRAKADRLEAEYARIQKKVKKLNASEFKIAQLEHKMALAEKNYRSYSDNLEQARIDSELENDNISNVNLIQPASLEQKPANPRKGIVAMLGSLLAVVGSIAVVIVSDQFDNSLRTPDEVERQLDVPVLMTLPQATASRVAVST